MGTKAMGQRPLERLVGRLHCALLGHTYRVLRRMNAGARKVGCDRCGRQWAMHDATQSFLPWDADFEQLYVPGGPLNPLPPNGQGNGPRDNRD